MVVTDGVGVGVTVGTGVGAVAAVAGSIGAVQFSPEFKMDCVAGMGAGTASGGGVGVLAMAVRERRPIKIAINKVWRLISIPPTE